MSSFPSPAGPSAGTRRWWRRLYTVPVGLAVGLTLAAVVPQGAPAVAWLGQVFLAFLKLLILPLIVSSIYVAVAGGHDLERVGRRTLLYYLLTSGAAAALGVTMGLLFSGDVRPGMLNLAQVSTPVARFEPSSLLARFVPTNIFASLAQGEVLHVALVAIVAALASRALPLTHRDTLLAGARAVDALLMRLLDLVLVLAPVGVALLVYAGLSGVRWGEILELRGFVWAVVLAGTIHGAVVMPGFYWWRTRRPPGELVRACREPLLTAFSTASSNATYPVSKRALEAFGVSESVTSLTLPIGATLNMHGSALYQAILLIFMSALAGQPLRPEQMVLVVGLTMVSSAGTAGVPGGGIAMMAFLLGVLGLPESYIGLYVTVDRFFDYPKTALNVWGDLVVAAVVDAEVDTRGEPAVALAAVQLPPRAGP